MIVVEDLKFGDEVLVSNCGIKCGELFVFKVLEKKKSINIICPSCGSKTNIRHLANGKTRKIWNANTKESAK